MKVCVNQAQLTICSHFFDITLNGKPLIFLFYKQRVILCCCVNSYRDFESLASFLHMIHYCIIWRKLSKQIWNLLRDTNSRCANMNFAEQYKIIIHNFFFNILIMESMVCQICYGCILPNSGVYISRNIKSKCRKYALRTLRKFLHWISSNFSASLHTHDLFLVR